jgi:hypothetical protein
VNAALCAILLLALRCCLLLLLGCINQSGVIKYNTEPNVTFTSPAAGSIFPSGTPITFTANASDAQQASDELDYFWTIAPTGSIDSSGQIIAGETVTLKLEDGLDAGEWTVTLQVVDGDGAFDEDTLVFTTKDYYSPEPVFQSPLSGGRYASAWPLSVAVAITDPDQSDLSRLTLSWGGLAASESTAPDHPDSSGLAFFSIGTPPLGSQVISIEALDDNGGTGNSEVIFEIVDGDLDNDGFIDSALGGDDCDDEDESIYPGAADLCDGIDNDCDGSVDEEPESWFEDLDGDGFGDPNSLISTCEPEAGMVQGNTDCDDGNASINPDATEFCNGLDDNCNGSIDDNAQDAPVWYVDSDGDGFGDPQTVIVDCTGGSGLVADSSDCDDGNTNIYPGALEICNGLDDDCDGSVDPSSAVGALIWYADTDSDGVGDSNNTVLSCDQPVGYLADNTDCNDGDSSVFPGATESCNGIDDDCDGTTDEPDSVDASSWYQDSDGDGYGDASVSTNACNAPVGFVANSSDCDDGDRQISPLELEFCDGLDNDCDGLIDESDAVDVLDWYLDLDSDGYGDPATLSQSCTAGNREIADNTDCADGDPLINPAAIELCDGLDNDCDGSVDPGSAADASLWYADMDGDGYGNPNSSVFACTQPAGFLANDEDCEDGNSSIHPAASEICDGLDNDCDALVDDADPSLDTSTGQQFFIDSDSDSYGDAASPTMACASYSGVVSDDTDCDDTTALAHPGLTEICNDGLDNDCDGTETGCGWDALETLDDYSVQFVGEAAGDSLGAQFIGFGEDSDLDGVQPILLGATSNDLGGASSGALWWLNDPDRGILTLDQADTRLWGDPGEQVGGSMLGSDLDEDGVEDLVVGIPKSTLGSSSEGAVQLLFGEPASGALSSAGGLIISGSSNQLIGSGLASGDMDADGIPELAIGASGANNNFSRVFVLEGPFSSGSLSASSAFLTITSTGYNTGLGDQLLLIDVDGDNYDDLVIGAPDESNFYSGGGAVYIVTGPITGSRSTSVADSYYYGSSSYHVGEFVNSPGDANGDGYPELIIGSASYNVGRGGVWLIHTGASNYKGIITSGDYATLTTSSSSGALGSVASGSIDSDGSMDLVVGMAGNDDGANNAGAALVYYGLGSMSGGYNDGDADVSFTGVYSSDAAGTRVACGDADGDGRDDLLVAAPGEDSGGSSAGSVYLIWAPNL